jgi:hypothetical protein
MNQCDTLCNNPNCDEKKIQYTFHSCNIQIWKIVQSDGLH